MTAKSLTTVHQPVAQRRSWLDRGVGLALFFGTLLLYLATLTDVHTFDALSYAAGVDQKPWQEMFHPHHLAYGPLGILALKLARGLGYEGRAALPLQALNAGAGALGVALFFSIVRLVTQRRDLALLAALLLGGAYAYWYYAVEIEVYTIATCFLLLCLALLLRQLVQPSPRQLLLLGLAQGGAVLFHQTNLLFCAPLAVALLAPSSTGADAPAAPVRARLRGWWLYLLGIALTTLGPYLFVGLVVSQFRSLQEFISWSTEYARTGWWGGPISGKKWGQLGQGLANTLAQPGGALLWLLLLGLFLLRIRQLLAGQRVLCWTLLSWLLVYGGFFLWWEPDNVEFWIASLPPALLLLALALRGERRWGPGIWLALGIALASLGTNYDSISRRGDASTDLQRSIVRALGANSGPADLLLVPDGLQELYLPYYEQRYNFLSLNAMLYASGGDWLQACAAIHERIETTRHAGAAVLIADEVLRPPELLRQRHQLDQQQVDACFAPYQAGLRPLQLPPQVPAYWRLLPAQEQAQSQGWSFSADPGGWRVLQVADSRFADGWHIQTGPAPMVLSPLLQLEAQRYQAVELRLAHPVQAGEGRLRYAGPDQQFSEQQLVRWQLAPTALSTTYRVDLDQAPGWQGRITRLRLDLVLAGGSGEVRLEWLRLIPR